MFVSPTQINALVPTTLTGDSANVVVKHFDQASPAFTVPLQATSPAVFTAA